MLPLHYHSAANIATITTFSSSRLAHVSPRNVHQLTIDLILVVVPDLQSLGRRCSAFQSLGTTSSLKHSVTRLVHMPHSDPLLSKGESCKIARLLKRGSCLCVCLLLLCRFREPLTTYQKAEKTSVLVNYRPYFLNYRFCSRLAGGSSHCQFGTLCVCMLRLPRGFFRKLRCARPCCGAGSRWSAGVAAITTWARV
jgi:hypothetical protein